MFSPRTTCAIFKRELRSYFESPVAYVFLVVFLVLTGFLTFSWTKFYERQVADLEPFFFWLPIVFLLLVPAATMGLWAEERRSGTIELILTMPVTMTEAIVGKFLAAWSFMTIAILLTAPMIFTVYYLGNPDSGPIFCGYLGAILMAGSYVAIGMLTSSFTRSQVVSFVISFVICLILLLAGTPIVTDYFVKLMPESDWLVYGVAGLSFWTHFDGIKRGIVDLRDLLYFASVIFFMIAATHVVLDSRKSA
jgi:ABC-2 type transport system permease protein